MAGHRTIRLATLKCVLGTSKNEDFIEGKRRRLKEGTAPFIFEDYSQRLQPKPVPNRSSSEEQERSNKRARFGDAGRTDASSAARSRSIPLPCTAITVSLHDDAPMDTLADGYSGQPSALNLEDKHDRGVQVDNRKSRVEEEGKRPQESNSATKPNC
ncbi:hypothetical protein HPB48_002825 [Haemaphysalis longicornis]|uniref:Uncharacterized protein n=1 Tax=Haemaphysalis longicornis TaxID=44386 RepID=A0A9J6FD60_HAELO|nr:hypothetical protein HPB48_002825 [Haemaphysalis longicornis]